MLHGGVLIPEGTLHPDAKTLVIIHTNDFCEGYVRGRRDYFRDYFTCYEEIAHMEDDLLDLLKAREQPQKHPMSLLRRVTVLQET